MTERDLHNPFDEQDIAEPWRRLVGFAVDWMVLVMTSLVIVSALGIDLGAGDATATVYTCDLSKEYVTINADYHT